MKYYFPLHLDGDNRGCEAIAKGTAILLDEKKDVLYGLCRNVSVDKKLGTDKYVTLIEPIIPPFYKRLKNKVIRTFDLPLQQSIIDPSLVFLSTIFTLRQNIYTNPQKPLQVEAKVYEFNEPAKTAPILLPTNFALTYFAVAGELESLPFGSYLVVTPSDGMSVLTAWSADKFTAELVARSVKNFGLFEKVNTRKIIIPGLLAHMRDELQEAMPEWEIVTGTIEACQIPEFLRQG